MNIFCTHRILCNFRQKNVINYRVYTLSHLIDDRGLEVHKHCPGHVLACPGLREEGVEGVVSHADRVIPGYGAVRVYPVLEAVQLPGRETSRIIVVK